MEYAKFLTPEAIEKLLQVKKHILEEPNRLCMIDWLRKGDTLYDCLDGLSSVEKVILNPPCKTAACIAGWICVLNGSETYAGPGMAINLLGLGPRLYDNFHRLFYVSRWDEDLKERFATTNLRERASAAAEQIDRFIERYKIAA